MYAQPTILGYVGNIRVNQNITIKYTYLCCQTLNYNIQCHLFRNTFGTHFSTNCIGPTTVFCQHKEESYFNLLFISQRKSDHTPCLHWVAHYSRVGSTIATLYIWYYYCVTFLPCKTVDYLCKTKTKAVGWAGHLFTEWSDVGFYTKCHNVHVCVAKRIWQESPKQNPQSHNYAIIWGHSPILYLLRTWHVIKGV